ncbi:MAG: divergent polysaccharide deacetylase family protein [Candidatus Eremiobacteraeota bacterium]|nr:divergent polysaccharide deacetylase family protein [Candidatus Eremiobacteraeota bacterium]MBV8333097.1 divergent polysaccharide deacetylase family protein [Candidatus Eremiobacteraeota bacterium]MBV8722685.1 divergent polysaccharide deacetylase family protein [Candidatus Eremiobacteraeota bacterium]
MRNAFWLILIAGALAAIIAGFVGGTLQTKPPPVAQLRRTAVRGAPLPPVGAGSPREEESRAADAFAQDDVVVDRKRAAQSEWQPERLQIVVAICGTSVAAESAFFRLKVPLTFVVDPAAPQASAVAQLARSNGDEIFVQTDDPPYPQSLAAYRHAIGTFDGIASRNAAGMPMALRGTGLSFFDERGDAANALTFTSLGVPLIQRDVTADNRSGAGYVRFMLERAAALSRRLGPVVVLMRPLPSSYSALRDFVQTHDVRMIALP